MNNEELFFNTLGFEFSTNHNISIEMLKKYYKFEFKKMDINNMDLEFDNIIEYNKRKNTGSYYTPINIAEYMIISVLIEYCVKNTSLSKESLFIIFSTNNNRIKNNEMLIIKRVLSDLKIADLSSGTGIFLLTYIKLIERIFINSGKENLSDLLKKIITKNIYAFDINDNALKILNLEMNNLFFKYDKKELLEMNTYNINSITHELIYSMIPKQGFDIVVGNPPYLGEKGNKDLFNEIKSSKFGKTYYEGKMDLFYFFIYRGVNVLNNKGLLIYLTTNYFITADGAKKLRKFFYLNGNFKKIINFNSNKIFKDAKGQHNLIFIYSKEMNCDIEIINFSQKISIETTNQLLNAQLNDKYRYFISKKELFGNDYLIKLFIGKEHYSIINKIENQSEFKISDYFNVNQGFISGADSVSDNSLNKKLSNENIKKYNIKTNDSIFVLKKDEIDKFSQKKYLKMLFKSSDIKKFSSNKDSNKYVLYIDNNIKIDNLLENHLKPYKEILDSRREVKSGARKWYSLQWPRTKEIFEKEKIVVPQRSRSNIFGYSNSSFYGSADIYYITLKEDINEYDLKILLALLNSKLYFIYLSNIGKKKGVNLELYATPIKNLLIKNINKKYEIIEIVNRLILNYNKF
ncbi:MAG: TaqI-like C-terminal specificity domain-containing protein, partial [Bacillota bacterium]|nr:TaqI-like C-terminal specificity domain-containing protein [Bacillota bacterium]